MSKTLNALACLRRSRLLIRAARFGAEEYRRKPHLDPLLGTGVADGPGAALAQLMALESEQEELRNAGPADQPRLPQLPHQRMIAARRGLRPRDDLAIKGADARLLPRQDLRPGAGP